MLTKFSFHKVSASNFELAISMETLFIISFCFSFLFKYDNALLEVYKIKFCLENFRISIVQTIYYCAERQ